MTKDCRGLPSLSCEVVVMYIYLVHPHPGSRYNNPRARNGSCLIRVLEKERSLAWLYQLCAGLARSVFWPGRLPIRQGRASHDTCAMSSRPLRDPSSFIT
jgi:hypothetical protein